jgi:hypothetical protein
LRDFTFQFTNLRFELRLMVIEIRKVRMDLRQPEMGKLFVDGIGASSVGDMVEGNLDNLDRRLIHARHAVFVNDDMRERFADRHGCTLAEGLVRRKADGRIAERIAGSPDLSRST